MQTRKATAIEILDKYNTGRSVRYRHFVRETYNPRAANGVSHRQFSHSKIRVIDGVPHVQYHGEIVPITGSHHTLETGYTFVANLRLDNEYLPE